MGNGGGVYIFTSHDFNKCPLARLRYCAKSKMYHANNWSEHKPESVLKSFKRKSVKCDGTSIYKQAKS